MPERVNSVAQLGVGGAVSRRRTRRRDQAFTLIDVLVTMAVISILISLLSPSLSSIRESARQVVCRSNVRQIGIGISMHADANKDLIPGSVNAPSLTTGQPWETMDLRLTATSTLPEHWDGLGHLYGEQTLPAAKIFYCASHHGNYPYADYAAAWGVESGSIVGNYQYRAAGLSQRAPAPNQMPELTNKLSQMAPYSSLVADGMRTQEDFNHRIGANVLRAGLSVDWWTDHSGVMEVLLPKDGQAPTDVSIRQAWEALDGPPR